jgi:hypothetical protein
MRSRRLALPVRNRFGRRSVRVDSLVRRSGCILVSALFAVAVIGVRLRVVAPMQLTNLPPVTGAFQLSGARRLLDPGAQQGRGSSDGGPTIPDCYRDSAHRG